MLDLYDFAYLQRVGEQMESAVAEFEAGTRPSELSIASQAEQVFTTEDCHHLVEELNRKEWRKGLLGMDGVGGVNAQRYSATEKFFDPSSASFAGIMDKLRPHIDEAEATFGFNNLRLVEQARLVRYGSGDHFNWHQDSDVTAPRRLTISAQLSAPAEYSGGGLMILGEDGSWHSASIGQGAICLFPASQLHRVVPVVSGERLALVLWCY